jgi:hypothetical protein
MRKEPRALPGKMSAQVTDFSPVITNFHDFRPNSQLQGFGFSPVTGFPGIFFICGRQSLHPLKCGIRNAVSSVEPCARLVGRRVSAVRGEDYD